MTNDVVALVLAGLFLFLALAALTLMVSLRRPRDPLLPAFACLVGLFGTRLAVGTQLFHDLAGAGRGELAADVITYLIPLPILLATAAVFAGRWRTLARALVLYQVLFAVVAIGVDVARDRPGSGMRLNNAAVAALLTLTAVYAFARRADLARALRTREGRVLGVGLLVFVIVALGQNLAELGRRPGPRVAESFALLVLVSCVGYGLAARVGRRETELAALERELELARDIQSALLPVRLPEVAGLDMAARYIPLSAVAGDFYDVIPQGGNGVTVIVADVTGHGVPAALVASMLKVACTTAVQELADPSQGLARVNRLLCQIAADRYVTAAWLDIDASNRRFVYAAAGHPPLLIWRGATRSVESVAENGLLLGLMPDAPYPLTQGVLERGDRLLLYTDGVIEASGPGGEYFEQSRLEAAIAEGVGLDADAFSSQLLRRLCEWHGAGPFDDDVTFVVVDVR